MIASITRARTPQRDVELVDGLFLRLVRVIPSERARAFERWIRGREEARRLRLADCVLASWAKSGRTWLRVMLAHYYEHEYGLAPVGLLDFDNLHRQNRQVPKVFFTHGNYLRDFTRHHDSKVDFYDKKVLLLVRDPRDVAVSQFFQWKYRMPDWKKKLNSSPVAADRSIFEFVLARDYGLPTIIDFLNGWAEEAPSIRALRIVRYEDMRTDPVRALTNVLEYLGTAPTQERVAAAVDFARFDNLRKLETGRAFPGPRLSPGDPDNPDSYKVRRGKVGGYRDYFDDDQLAVIDRLTRTTLSPLYGYQTS
jgi:hypothetical protein